MKFKCPYCGHGVFVVSSNEEDKAFATCQKCGKVTPFEMQQMTHPQMRGDKARRLHLK
jgi:transcription elongation factor Elf1